MKNPVDFGIRLIDAYALDLQKLAVLWVDVALIPQLIPHRLNRLVAQERAIGNEEAFVSGRFNVVHASLLPCGVRTGAVASEAPVGKKALKRMVIQVVQ